MDCIILCGGKGTRMDAPIPKALVEAHGKAILAHQLDYLSPQVDKIVLALGHGSEQIIAFVEKEYPDAAISWSIEEEPLGTGGGLKQAMRLCSSDKVLVLNGDDLTDIDVSTLGVARAHTICVANPQLPFGLVSQKEGLAYFEEKPTLEHLWVSCGWYLFLREEVMAHLPDSGSLEYEVFPKIDLRVHRHRGWWRTVNSKKDLERFAKGPLPSSFL